jgi:hypothetical protein
VQLFGCWYQFRLMVMVIDRNSACIGILLLINTLLIVTLHLRGEHASMRL